MRLTGAGREFYEDTVQLLAIRERALTRKPAPTPRNTLRISCRSDASTMVLGHACERCAELYPEVEQVIVPLRSEVQLEAIVSGRADVTEWPQSTSVGNYGLSFRSLVESPHVCVVRRQHPLAQAKTVSLTDLEGIAVTMLDRGRCCNADRLRDLIERDYPGIRLPPSQFDASQRLVGTANGLAIVMPRVFAEGNLDENRVMRPLDVNMRMSVGLVYRAEKPSEALGKFLDAAEKAFEE